MKWSLPCILIIVLVYFIGASYPGPAQMVKSKLGF